MKVSHWAITHHKQRGAALIVGLIMLLLLTLIGVAGMRDTLLQEKMVGNMRNREIALQAAESALRAGEAQLGAINEPIFSNSSGLYDLATVAGKAATARLKSGAPVTEQAYWQQDSSWTAANSIVYPFTLDDVVNAPRYVIERLPISMTDKSQYAGGSDPNFVTDITGGSEVPEVVSLPDYRITARGQGTTADAVVILQGTYRRRQ